MSILGLLFPLLLFGVIVNFLQKRGQYSNSEWFELIPKSREDFISHVFLTLSVAFLGITIYAFNRDFGTPIDWQWIVLSTVVVALCVGYYYRIALPVILSLGGFMVWWTAQAIEWTDLGSGGEDVKPMAVFVGVILIALLYYVTGQLHRGWEKYKSFGLLPSLAGMTLITLAMFFFSMQAGLESMVDLTQGQSIFSSWPISASLALMVTALLAGLVYAFRRKQIVLYEGLVVVFIAAVFAFLLFIPGQTLFINSGSDLSTWNVTDPRQNLTYIGVMWAVVFNVLLLVKLLGVILLGYLRQRIWLINYGAFGLFVFVVVKYFDWFFTFLDKSLFFIGAGILFFAVGGLMERGRRYMVEKTENK